MIDVMKRLAELDAANPNIIKEAEGTVSCSSCGEKFKIAGRKDGFSHCKDHAGKKALDESADLAECGPMGMMDAMGGMGQSHTPASVNITAGSGEELSNMLKDIMSLAGVHQVEPDHLGAEHEPMALTAEPVAAVGPMASAGDEMRSVIDKLNPDTDGEEEMGDEEETDEGQYDNSPHGARDVPSFKHDAMLNKDMQNQDQSGPPGQGDRFDGKQPKAHPTFESQLMDDYRKFVAEISPELATTVAARRGQQADQLAWGKKFPDAYHNDPRVAAYQDKSVAALNYAQKRGATDKMFGAAMDKVQAGPAVPMKNIANPQDINWVKDQVHIDAITDLASARQEIADYAQHNQVDQATQKGMLDAAMAALKAKGVAESKPSAGMSAKEKSSVVKKAKAGKDIGKPGKSFKDISAPAAKKYGSQEKGDAAAAAAMWKNAAKK